MASIATTSTERPPGSAPGLISTVQLPANIRDMPPEAAIVYFYNQGFSIKAVAAKCGLGKSKVRRILVETDVQIRKRGPRLNGNGEAGQLRISHLVALYEDGHTIKECARLCEISYGTARGRLLAEGVILRRRGQQPKWVRDVDVARLARLYKNDHSIRDCARLCGTSYATAHDRLTKSDIMMRARGGTNRYSPNLISPAIPLPVSVIPVLSQYGYRKKEISRLTGRSHDSVHRELTRAQLPARVHPDRLGVDIDKLVNIYRLVASSKVTGEVLHISRSAVLARLREANEPLLDEPSPDTTPVRLDEPAPWQRQDEAIARLAARGETLQAIANAVRKPVDEVAEVLRLLQHPNRATAQILRGRLHGESPGVIALRTGVRLDRVIAVLNRYSARADRPQQDSRSLGAARERRTDRAV